MTQASTKFARPYAKALYQLASQAGNEQHWQSQLKLLSELFVQDKIVCLLQQPKLSLEQKIAEIEKLMGDDIDQVTLQFLKVLGFYGKLLIVPEIARLFEQTCQQAAHVCHAEVYTAMPLSDALQQQLAKALQNQVQQSVTMTVFEDKSLMGGILVKMGDRIIDGSVRGQLSRLRTQLAI